MFKIATAALVLSCLVLGCSNKGEHDVGKKINEPCICLKDRPLDYVIRLRHQDAHGDFPVIRFSIGYTVKYIGHSKRRAWDLIPHSAYRIVYEDKTTYWSLEEPIVLDNGLMKFINANTRQEEAINFTRVKWTIEPLKVLESSRSKKRREYGDSYYKQYKKCKAEGKSCRGSSIYRMSRDE